MSLGQVEIQMGGVPVKPGEWVLGDDDGLVVCLESIFFFCR